MILEDLLLATVVTLVVQMVSSSLFVLTNSASVRTEGDEIEGRHFSSSFGLARPTLYEIP
jgi:hypothetical protein